MDKGNGPLCGGLRGSSLAVDSDGQVYGCPFFEKSCLESYPGSFMTRLKTMGMGDIRDPALLGRRSAVVRAAREFLPADWETRRYSTYGNCTECQYRTRCFICPVSIWSKPDSPEMICVPDFICAFNRLTLKYRERFPCAPGEDEDPLRTEGPDPIGPLETYLRARQLCQ